jgi:SAM-dependent methyltransferase
MVDLYNQKVYNQGIPKQEMAAYCLDICDDNVKYDHFSKDYFDAEVVSMAYYHLPDVRFVTKKIVNALKPGGWLYVVDIEGDNDDHGHGPRVRKHEHQSDLAELHFKFSEEDAARHRVAHRGGLTADSVMDAFKNAGLELVGAQKAIKIKLWFEKERLPPFVKPDKLDSLSTRIGKDGKTLHLVRWHLMVTGRKKRRL